MNTAVYSPNPEKPIMAAICADSPSSSPLFNSSKELRHDYKDLQIFTTITYSYNGSLDSLVSMHM